jgi:hypothetical protein
LSVSNDSRSPGQDWHQIIERKSLDDFAAAFTEDAVLDASVLNGPVKGPSGIRSVFCATAAMYETIVFIHETICQRRFLSAPSRATVGGRTGPPAP